MRNDPFEKYPLEAAVLQKWISEGSEGIHLEFKQLISISEPKSKAEFIRDMMSLANMAWSHKKPSYLVVGVTDSSEVVDSSESMDDDAIYQQILDAFVSPPIDFALRKEVIQDVPVYVFVISPVGNFHKVKKAIQESGKSLLAKDECWFRKGSSKYQIKPLRMFQLKYGGMVIQTPKKLAEWLRISPQRVNTLISDENLIKNVIDIVFPLKSPSMLVGPMGCGKTTLLYQIGLSFLERNFCIVVDLEKYPEDLSSALHHHRLILFIDSLESILEVKKIKMDDISPDLPLISTMRTLNWQRYCRTSPRITELFTKIDLPHRVVDNVRTADFLRQIAYANIQEFQISIPDEQTQQEKVLDLLIAKSEGVPLYITEIISDIIRLSNRNGTTVLLDENYLQSLPSGIHELALTLLHRDFIAVRPSDDLTYQIELFTLSLCAHFNKPGSPPGFVHKRILNNLTHCLKPLWGDNMQLMFVSPFPSDFLVPVGCELYQFSHSFWIDIFMNPTEALESISDSNQQHVVEKVVMILTSIKEIIDDKMDELRRRVDEAVARTIAENQENLTRSLVLNSLDIPYASPIPEWKNRIPKEQYVKWLDNEIDDRDSTPFEEVPSYASRSMFWTLLNSIIGQLLEGELSLLSSGMAFWFDIVNSTDTVNSDKKQKITTLGQKGTFLIKFQDFELGRAFYLEALELTKKNKIIEMVGSCYGGLADSYYYEGDIEASMELYHASLQYDLLVHDEYTQNSIITLIRLVEIALSSEELEDVDDTLDLIFAYADKESDVIVKSKGHLLKGYLEFRRNNRKEALYHLEQAHKIAEKFHIDNAKFEAEIMIEQISNPIDLKAEINTSLKRKTKKKMTREGYWQCHKNPQHRFPLKTDRVRKGRCFCGGIASRRFK